MLPGDIPAHSIYVSTDSSLEITWRATAELHVRNWDGDYVVYNPLSGNTHILDIVTGEILRTVLQAPVRASAIPGQVANFLEMSAADGGLAQHVGDILGVLDDLGLIEPAGGC